MNDADISKTVEAFLGGRDTAVLEKPPVAAAPVAPVAAPAAPKPVAERDLVAEILAGIAAKAPAQSSAETAAKTRRAFEPGSMGCTWEATKAESPDLVSEVLTRVLNAQGVEDELPLPESLAASFEAISETGFTALGDGVFATMDEAVEAADAAQKQYLFCSMAARQRFVDGIREVVLAPAMLNRLARMAAEETGMGNAAHKVIKNRLAAEKTPGTEDLTTDACTGDSGLTLVEYSAYGVIGAITPTTNPTETIICNGIGMLAAGNSVVFSVHPRATKVSLMLIKLLNRKLAALGAPENLIVTVQAPSIENTNAMMAHPKVRMLVATGGPGIVRAVMASGKKAIGAGAGNPPVVVDETADLDKAAQDIVNGSSFDNNLPCIAEKEVIVVEQVADYLVAQMQARGAYLVSDPALIRRLEETVLNDKGGPATECVGKSAAHLLEKVGIKAGHDVKLILIELPKTHPFVQEELMMPILPVVRAPSVDEAIDLAVELEKGNRHTAMMHSTNVRKLTKMAKLIQTTVFVKNGPSYAGLGAGGEGFNTFTIAGPTGEGLTSARSFARKRRCVMCEALNVR
ncbi:aldehyde dehydrogenase EutE [Salipiger bermudensis]|uniref:aldehyde dehydrogenase family protein n=1 Tax=Salipiger bermudensis TaxID=344736 RepID=UPI001C996DA5|nr:aldehyde dehydrogenase family protein [Salipiger bermudensis]MBY6003021.1 aldehyde dehydrogenase EutE [Salipiger bermudensis]